MDDKAFKSLLMIIRQEYNVDIDNPDETKNVALHKARQINNVINRLLQSRQDCLATEIREGIYELLRSAVGLIDNTNGNSNSVAHLERVGRYARLLAKHHIVGHQSDYPSYDAEKYSRDLAKAASLHDIGKVCLPKELLVYPGIFNDAQRETMKVHVDCGRIILTIEGCLTGKDTRVPLARCSASEHHMPEYGSYVCGSQRPSLAGMIVKLVDGLDAGTSARSYDSKKPFDQVVDSIGNSNRITYDPKVVATFCRHIEEFRQLHNQLHGLH